ncbi:hypothetical protein KC614_00445 [candidate division WWE3 bacterium]|uniref:Uncharacterized protein n=1 Tax=candidate division WWE3 bacterium TaxID=2053526 RepID=A0A955LJL7_UNCKA|nr:hypothetical protein [candidate division WWE3 bacterium]
MTIYRVQVYCSPREILLEADLRYLWDVKEGNFIEVNGRTFRITGVVLGGRIQWTEAELPEGAFVIPMAQTGGPAIP